MEQKTNYQEDVFNVAERILFKFTNYKDTKPVDLYPDLSPWVHQFDPNYVPDAGERNFQPSMTIPDQSMSVQEIMRRYAQGLPLGGEREALYDDDDDTIPDFTGWDLADIEAWKNNAEQEIKDTAERFNRGVEIKKEQDLRKKWKSEQEDEEPSRQSKPKKEQKVLGKLPTDDQDSPDA